MISFLSWVLVVTIVILLLLYEKEIVRQKNAAFEQRLRDIARSWVDELVDRGFSVREISMNTGLDIASVGAWHIGVGDVPCDADITRLIDMTMEARRAFIHIHQRVVANRAGEGSLT